MDLVQLARKIISVESSTTTGNRNLALELAELCRSRGLQVEFQEQSWAGSPQLNLLARKQLSDPNEPWLLLQDHLDTPDPGPYADWVQTGHNPFDAHVIDGKIYGLGAADAKVDFLCKLEALSQWKPKTRVSFCPTLLGTFGEENGMMGALKFIRNYAPQARWALVGEATQLKLVTAAKGMAMVEIRVSFEPEEKARLTAHERSENTSTQSKLFRGKAAHSSRPQDGESAIHKMLDYLLLLPSDITLVEVDGGQNFNTIASHAFMEFDLGSQLVRNMASKIHNIYKVILEVQDEFLQYFDSDFEPGHPTLNIGSIRTFDDHVLLAGTCRIPPSIQQEEYERWMRKIHDVCVNNGADMRVTDYKKPFRTPEDSELIKVAQSSLAQMQLSTTLSTLPLTNEASLFSRVGLETLCFGPGQHEGNLHTPHEHVPIASLEKAVAFYRGVLCEMEQRRTS